MEEIRLIHTFPATERVVGICNYRDTVIVATEDRIYEVVDDGVREIPLVYDDLEEVKVPKSQKPDFSGML